MTIRARMVLWYSAILLISALVIATLAIDELREQHSKDKETGETLLGIGCWIGIPAILLSVGGGAWMMRKALAPVADLTKAAQGISEHPGQARLGLQSVRVAQCSWPTRPIRRRRSRSSPALTQNISVPACRPAARPATARKADVSSVGSKSCKADVAKCASK